MNGLFLAGVVVGLVVLLGSRNRERRLEADAFTALDRLTVDGPIRMPAAYVVSAVAGAAAVLAGLPSLDPAARASGALAMAVVVWLLWLDEWVSLRWLLDAAIVFQDHVPPDARPAAAFSPAPKAALSFRPLGAALTLLGALGLTGAGFGLLSAWFGWTRLLPLMVAGVWTAIGLAFAAYVRGALRAERRVRSVLGGLSSAGDDELFEALRRNPRSARLLLEHARRLELAGQPMQALLEYRSAELAGSFAEQSREGAARARRKLGRAAPGPVEGSIVRGRTEAQPRMRIEPLFVRPDALPVRVTDPAAFVRELLALEDEGLVFGIEGEIDATMAEELHRFEHLAPLITPDTEWPGITLRAWRLAPEVREAVRERIRDGVPKGWVHLHVYTLGRILLEARGRFANVRAAPDLLQREFIEWRRAAAVAPMKHAGEPDDTGAEQPAE